MILELILALFAGIIIGVITGLAPGVHINLVANLTLANMSLFAGFPGLAIAVFISALSITHIFIDFIPSVFLGAPEEDTILAVLPGHRLLKSGKGCQAVKLMCQGAIIALLLGVLCIPIYLLFLDKVQLIISSAIPYLLICASLFIILREHKPISALMIFIFSGFLGFLSFNMPVKDPLLPLLSGLFGVSGLITSISAKERIPKQVQESKNILMPKKKYIFSIIPAAIIGPICSFLPGIGSSHISMISSEIVRQSKKQFLFLNGISSTLAMFLSFIAAYCIGKTRTGSAAAIQEVLGKIGSFEIGAIAISVLLAGVAAYFLSMGVAKRASVLISRINYTYVSVTVIILLSIVNILLTNYLGLLVLATSSALGVWAIRSGARRINLMGSLILPTVLYYLAY